MTIYKYILQLTDRQVVNMPGGAKILTVDTQGINLCLWALVDPKVPEEPRAFIVHGTGHPADDLEGTDYVGTAQLHAGALVLHVFEVRKETDA